MRSSMPVPKHALVSTFAALVLASITTPGSAQHTGHETMDHSAHVEGADADVTAMLPAPTEAERAAAFPDLTGSDMSEMMLMNPLNKLVLLDRFETQDTSAGNLLQWDLEAWVGRDTGKLWLRSEGQHSGGDTQHAELEVLWGRSFTRWWDLLAGARHDFEPAGAENWAAVGVRGTAPYRFDVEATAFLGDAGRAALRIETRYEILVTNRLILQPLVEANWYARDDSLRGLGPGLADAEIGLRLRYEVRREIAPYVGLVREQKYGRTADLARAAGEGTGDTRLTLGIRLWF